MTAVEESVRFYVDETSLGLGKVLEIARHDVIHCGHRLIPECPHGILGIDWIPLVAARGLVVITLDKHIRTRPAELSAFRDGGLRAFFIGPKDNDNTWSQLALVVKYWNTMERAIHDNPLGPWLKALTQTGLKDLRLEH
jgi:hypothetical protein